MEPIRIFIDTDIGDDVDDALAIALAALSPELTLTGVSTVYGNVSARRQLAVRSEERRCRERVLTSV